MLRHATLACGLAVLATGSAFAGPLNPDHVAADARWLVHVDLERFTNSAVGKCFLAHHQGEEMEGVDEINEALDIDVLHDLLSLTLYSSAEKSAVAVGMDVEDDEVSVGAGARGAETAVAVAIMTDAADRMIERLKEADSYAEVHKDGHVLHSFIERESGKRHNVFVRPDANPSRRLVIAGPEIVGVVRAIDVVDGKSESLRKGDAPLANAAPRSGSFFFSTAVEIDGLTDEEPVSQILDRSSQVTVDFGETDGQAFGALEVTAETQEDARNISQILQGLVALGRVVMANGEDAEPLLKMLNAVKFDARNSIIVAGLDMSAEECCELIKITAEHHGHDFGEDDDDDHEHDEDDDGESHGPHRHFPHGD